MLNDNEINEIVDKRLMSIADSPKLIDKFGDVIISELRFQFLYCLSRKMNVYIEDLPNMSKIRFSFHARLVTSMQFLAVSEQCSSLRRGALNYIYTLDNSDILNDESKIKEVSNNYLNESEERYNITLGVFYRKAKGITEKYNFKDKKDLEFKYEKIEYLKKYFYNAARIYKIDETKQIVIYFEYNQIHAQMYLTNFTHDSNGLRYSDNNFIRNEEIRSRYMDQFNSYLEKKGIPTDSPLTMAYVLSNYHENKYGFDNVLRVLVGYDYYFKECFDQFTDEDIKLYSDYTFSALFKIYNPIEKVMIDTPGSKDITIASTSTLE